MKATGVVRKVDELGRVVLPIELRRGLGIREKDPLEIYVDGNNIILRRYNPGCMECGTIDSSVVYGDKVRMCKSCLGKLAKEA